MSNHKIYKMSLPKSIPLCFKGREKGRTKAELMR